METMWAIIGVHGLYIGTWLTRRDAITEHVRMKFGAGFFIDMKRRDKLWKRCKRQGDRVVKVEIRVTN